MSRRQVAGQKRKDVRYLGTTVTRKN